MMDRQTIIVSAYTKSGSTWVVRLLADILNCPSAGSHSSQDKKEIASEGWDRPGNFIVRKGHYRLGEISDFEKSITTGYDMIPEPHVIFPHRQKGEHIIFLIRDPRDIIVSACHHWKRRSRKEIINLVCHGGLANLPAWDEYLEQWWKIENCIRTSYEMLLRDTFTEIHCVLNELDYDKSRLIPAIGRQSFNERKKQIAQSGDDLYLGKEYNLNFMRKGIVGDYKNFLTEQEQDYTWDNLGEMMERARYER